MEPLLEVSRKKLLHQRDQVPMLRGFGQEGVLILLPDLVATVNDNLFDIRASCAGGPAIKRGEWPDSVEVNSPSLPTSVFPSSTERSRGRCPR